MIGEATPLALLLTGLVAVAAAAAAVAVHGVRGALEALREAAWPLRVELAGGALLYALLLGAAAGEVPLVLAAGVSLLAVTAFAGLFLLALRVDARLERLGAAAARMPLALLAVAAGAAALLAHETVLGGMPHVSDEVAYLFQAKALAVGRLGFAPPPDAEAFGFLHTRVQGGIWHGIMNPGWPALLALGVRAGAPALVAPILAALTVLGLHAYLRRAGAAPALARLSALALAVSPFFVFQAATAMSHTASLACFVGFALGWQGAREGRKAAALGAGLALALGILVRPLDAVATALPFGVSLLVGAVRRPPLRAPLGIVGGLVLLGVAATLAYNARLTGDPWVFPQTRYFEEVTPGQRFGLGFGDDMGTRVHGAEWPGFHPHDVPRVTGYRLVEAFADVHGLGLLTAAALVGAIRRRVRAPGLPQLAAAAALLVGAYALHFYHGVAYGSRHLFLALPALVVASAWPLAEGLRRGGAEAVRARAALAAGLASVALVATPPLVALYGDRYRMAGPEIREAVASKGLSRALVLVDPAGWGWKSAFPLNDYPLEANDVLFAQDSGTVDAGELERRFPERALWRARLRRGGVTLEPLERPVRPVAGSSRGAGAEGAPRSPGAEGAPRSPGAEGAPQGAGAGR